MTDIRIATPDDTPAIRALYPAAFPEEDLLPLVSDLLGRADVLSLVATGGDAVTGHIAFTTCHVAGAEATLALLGPLAITPAHQRTGLGTALIRDGIARLTAAGAARVFVLGDPAYYGRHGFTAEAEVTPPHPLPDTWSGAWQSLSLGTARPDLSGPLTVPPPWQPRALWAP